MWIHVLGEQTQPSVRELLLDIKTLPLAQEVPELHIAGGWATVYSIQEGKAGHFLVLTSSAGNLL